MKATPLAPFFAAILAAALCAFWPGPSSAQGRDNPFAVAGLHVDEVAANSAAARQQAFASAQQMGFQRLVRRLALAEDLARQGMPQADPATIERMVLSVDVEDERFSGTRYIGRLTVRYDPNSVRNFLRAAGLNMVETRAAPILLVPTAYAGVDPSISALWTQVWTEGGYGQELTPLTVAPIQLGGAPDWNAARPFAQDVAAGSALYAALRVQGSVVSANLTEVGPDGMRRERGDVTARAPSMDDAGYRIALADLADQASARVHNEWKSRLSTGSGQRARVSASALYSNLAQWNQIKDGLEAAAATLISEIRIEAVGREGALVSFSYVGDPSQLALELQRRGVSLQDSAMGPVLRATARR
jgi:Uncharacterized protein conserved in bacteria (DUF2066)